MVTLLRADEFRFYFWRRQRRLARPHFHVSKGAASAKWWLNPLKEAWTKGMGDEDKARVAELAETYAGKWLEEWYSVTWEEYDQLSAAEQIKVYAHLTPSQRKALGFAVEQKKRIPPKAPATPRQSAVAASSAVPKGGDSLSMLGWVIAILMAFLVVRGCSRILGGISSGSSARSTHWSSPRDTYIDTYRRSDGSSVRGHYRTLPDDTIWNNYSGPNGDYFRQLNGR